MRTSQLRAGLIMLLVLGIVQSLLLAPVGAQDPPAAEVEVGLPSYFAPDVLEVAVGQTVRFTVASGTHTITSDDCGSPPQEEDCYTNTRGEVFSSGMVNAGDTFDFTFDEAGSFDYFCAIHSAPDGTNQNGVITVGEGPTDPPTPPETPPGDPQPVSGADPVETALAWSALLADGSAETALIGTDGAFADSLASGVAQGALDAPLLLTDGQALDERVADELARLGVQRVIILGGNAAISDDVEAQLAMLVDTVDRAGGATRLETARTVADLVAPDATSVLIARAFGEGTAGFADSLGAGAVAALTTTPVVLTPGEGLDPALGQWLQQRGVTDAGIVGGVAAVSEQVEADLAALGIAVTRHAGVTRFSTAAALRENLADPAVPATVVEGTGDLAWASGFAAALTAPGGILLSAGTELPGTTIQALFGPTDVRCGPTIGAAACAQAGAAGAVSSAEPAPLTAVMDDAQEPEALPTGASGLATVHRAGQAAVCITSVTYDLSDPITAAHIHAGAAGVSGPAVVPFELSPVDGTPGMTAACAPDVDSAVVAAVYADPDGHYVNVHTAMNPGGEARGQLFELGRVLLAELTGAAEVPGPGDPTATGRFRMFDTGVAHQLCYVIDQGDLDPAAQAAHIHQGDATTAGDVVHPLQLGGGSTSAACDRGVDTALVAAILADPAGYYVNLHNEPFPAGAVRGQLDAPAG